jgi:hypothetical protein
MHTLDPIIAVRSLGAVSPGALVQLTGGERGFCTADPRNPANKFVVRYRREPSDFRYALVMESVLDFGHDLIIAPEIGSLVENLLPGRDGTSQLLLTDDAPRVVFRMGDGDETPHLLNLKTGEIESLRRAAGVIAFARWSVGGKTVAGGFLPLLEVRASGGADGPTEPDEV